MSDTSQPNRDEVPVYEIEIGDTIYKFNDRFGITTALLERDRTHTLQAISHFACIPIEELEAWVHDYKLMEEEV